MIKIICCGIIFQQQLQALLETLSATEPHYIRCVKPINLLKPAIFENDSVLQQLCCGVRIGLFTFFYCHWQLIHDKKKHSFFLFFFLRQGVMEAVRISCSGYPTRRTFVEFIQLFGLLAPQVRDGR